MHPTTQTAADSRLQAAILRGGYFAPAMAPGN